MLQLDLARAHMDMRLAEANSYRSARDQQRQARARSTRLVGVRRVRQLANQPVAQPATC